EKKTPKSSKTTYDSAPQKHAWSSATSKASTFPKPTLIAKAVHLRPSWDRSFGVISVNTSRHASLLSLSSTFYPSPTNPWFSILLAAAGAFSFTHSTRYAARPILIIQNRLARQRVHSTTGTGTSLQWKICMALRSTSRLRERQK